MTKTKRKLNINLPVILKPTSERLKIIQKVRGIWKNKKKDPLIELEKIRKEWERNYVYSGH